MLKTQKRLFCCKFYIKHVVIKYYKYFGFNLVGLCYTLLCHSFQISEKFSCNHNIQGSIEAQVSILEKIIITPHGR